MQSDTLNEAGFVVSYGDLKPFKEYIDSTFDHRHLNDVLPFQTSAENIAKHLLDWCKRLWPGRVSAGERDTENMAEC